MTSNQGTVLLKRGPRTDDELWEFIYTFWNIKLARTAVCSNHTPPFQAFADAFFARYPVTVWKASRGFGGKSTMLGTLALTEGAMGAEVTVLGGSAAQSLRVKEVVQDELFDHQLAPKNMITHMTKWDTELATGGHIRALTASQRSVRGPHPQRLRLDEIDEMELAILEAAQGQPMMKHGIQTQTVMSSTHQYPDKTMSVILERAKENGWPVHIWCIAEGSSITTERGNVPIESLRTNDLVLTRNGWKPIQHVTFMGIKKTITLHFDNGRQLKCTPDHRVLTPSGWVTADAASSVVSIEPDVPIIVSASSTESSPGLEEPRPSLVLARSNNFQMSQVDARTISADVVEMHSFRDSTYDRNPNISMNIHGRVVSDRVVDALQSVTVPLTSSPLNAIGYHVEHNNVVRVENTNTVAVYDIGVHGEHEFVAEGVVVHNCYRENLESNGGWLPDSEIARKKTEISKHMWEVEYELQEPSLEGRAIDTLAVDTMFDPELGVYEGSPRELIELDPTDKNIARVGWDFSDARYATGVDWAKEKDWTVIWTFAVPYNPQLPWVLVAYERMNKLPWPVMARKFDQRLNIYPGAGVHDATGIGNVVSDLIINNVKDVVLSGQVRDGLWAEFVSGVEGGMFKAPRINFAYNEIKFATIDDLWGTGHTPDSFVAGALAWATRKVISRPQGLSIVSVTKESHWQ